MADFEQRRLGAVLTLQRGHDITKAEQQPGPYPVISSSGPTSHHSEYKCEGPGVVVGRKGSLGGVYWSEGSYWPHDTTLWVRDFKDNHPKFIYYFLHTLDLARFDVGASNPTLNRNHLHAIEVRIPPLPVQKRIAYTLSTLDDLIDSNRSQVAILEATTRLLYREWFVHFRFPGHEAVELVDSDFGPIPEDWEVSQVSDVLETVGGGTPAKTEEAFWEDGTVQWFTPTDLTRAGAAFAFDSALKITERGLKKSSAKLFPAGSVMMTSRATIGTISIAATPATTNQGFITCVPSDRLTSNYIYFWLHANVDLFLSLAGGATFKELRKSTLRELPLLLPGQREMDSFEDSVEPMMSLLKNLLQQNQVLLEARDLLLPRLVSGELDVSELDLGLEAV
ncbi:MAG: restriction endonuclease subunit S [Acidimicrobiaceae bacterium]|nr:restriction endonuclease subunit S [Acidimicrobiaceae bacterium]MYI34977.1 restriction endonuclease subunit S [Acidimicrobiaceae bacterium]